MLPRTADATRKNSQLGRFATPKAQFQFSDEPLKSAQILLPAQISSLSLLTIVMGPTLSLNSLPNSKYLHSSYVFCLLFHKENRRESSRSIPNDSILTLLSLDLSSEVTSSTFLCFRSYPATLILCFFQDLPCLSHSPQILGYKCT